MLTVKPIRTTVFRRGQDLDDFLALHLAKESLEGKLLAITSKIVSLSEGQLVSREGIDKADLIRREADHFLCETGFGVNLTIKHGLVIPSSGIDESNSEGGDYILYPKDPFGSAERIYRALVSRFKLSQFGIVITDSHTQPLRRGVVGVGLSYWGFRPTKNLVGAPDLFGRKLKMTSVNLVDSLSVAAVMVMGEAAECQPLALIDCSQLVFESTSEPKDLQIPIDEDLYAPLLQSCLRRQD